MDRENPNLITLGRDTIRLVRVQTEEEIAAGAPLEFVEPLIVGPDGKPIQPVLDAKTLDESAFVESPRKPVDLRNINLNDPPTWRSEPPRKPIHDYVAAAEPVPDFISAYGSWAHRFEMPREVHEALATLLIAALLNSSKVLINCRGYKLTLDFWLSVFAPSGIGKDNAEDNLQMIIDAANLGHLIDNSNWGSKEAFYQQLSGREIEAKGKDKLVSYNDNAKFYIWGEFASMLKKFDSPAFSGVKEELTAMYDKKKPPSDILYSKTGASTNTPDIEFPHAPRTNILALSTPEWFHANLNDTDPTGGFLARWTFVDTPGRIKPVAVTTAPDYSKIPSLARALQIIRNLRGEVTFFDGFWDHSPTAPGPYRKWYDAAFEQWHDTHPVLGGIFFRRHRGHVLKLAATYASSMTRTLHVTYDAWDRAVAKAGELEATLFRLLRGNMSKDGHNLIRMEDFVESAGQAGIMRSVFTGTFKNVPNFERLRQKLLESETIWCVAPPRPRGALGAPPAFYVHARHYAAVKALSWEDRPWRDERDR